MPIPPELTLYFHEWCHLCDDMREALAPLVAAGRLRLREIDLEQHPEHAEAYALRIPVLVGPDGAELCNGRLDHEALRGLLE
ncbi:MAG: glutaredoxin family protein [Pseudomonadota bacterium]